jgi:hypothetical protein
MQPVRWSGATWFLRRSKRFGGCIDNPSWSIATVEAK